MYFFMFALLSHLAYAQVTSEIPDGQIPAPTSLTPVGQQPTSVPSASLDKGNFTIGVTDTNATTTIFNVLDSLSDQAGGVAIPHTDQLSICTLTSDAKEGTPVACSKGAWEIFYRGTTATIRHYVKYKDAYVIRGGNVVKADEPTLARREASQIPILSAADPGPPAKSYTLDQYGVSSQRPASDATFDYIDGTGGLIV